MTVLMVCMRWTYQWLPFRVNVGSVEGVAWHDIDVDG